tara:strand:+ start:433 stop:660 length:228 start_codon:yes stop_codon:yes gene_type:complete
MGFGLIIILIFIILIGIYSLLLLNLNQSIVTLDLFFIELDFSIGQILLATFLTGMIVTLLLEFFFFLARKKNKHE